MTIARPAPSRGPVLFIDGLRCDLVATIAAVESQVATIVVQILAIVAYIPAVTADILTVMAYIHAIVANVAIISIPALGLCSYGAE